MAWPRPLPLVLIGLGLFGLLRAPSRVAAEPTAAPRGCPPDMVRVRGFCIDRHEMSTVDDRSGHWLSPYYPPEPKQIAQIRRNWEIERQSIGDVNAREFPLPALPEIQRTRTDYRPRAVSRAAVIPQGYLSYYTAKRACEAAQKRLCTETEWLTACAGQQGRKFPYGDSFEPGRCNVYRLSHPAAALHAATWYGHRDPRLNLVDEPNEGPLLRRTGATTGCGSDWRDDKVFDLVGNLDEWVDTETDSDIGLFVGGFYARSTREGCNARVSNHSKSYYDYSTGARCCKAP